MYSVSRARSIRSGDGSHRISGVAIVREYPPAMATVLTAPFAGTVIAIAAEPGDPVAAGHAVVILEAMKMEHEVIAEPTPPCAGVRVAVGDTVEEGQPLADLAPPTAGPARRAEPRAAEPSAPTAPRGPRRGASPATR